MYDSEGHSYVQLVIGSFLTTMHLVMHQVSCTFLAKHEITPLTAPLQPRFGTLWLLAFPKLKITFEREEISDCQWDSGKYDRTAGGNWENCVRPQGSYFEGDWGVIVLCTVFLVSYILFNNCLYFSHYIAGYFHDRPCIPDVVLMLERWWNSVYFIV